MGRAKAEMMEDDARGWSEPDGHVCADCVEDEYLKDVIRGHANERHCDYCGRQTKAFSAAPVVVLMEPIADAVFHYFNDPTQAGVPYESGEGGWTEPLVGTHEMLGTIGLYCHDDLFEDIADAFIYTEWVRASDGHWLGSRQSEELSALWDGFVDVIKHEVRFFFQHPSAVKPTKPREADPQSILITLEDMVKNFGLLDRLKAEISLFRVRERNDGADWEINSDQMGAPPPERARAGRMNPAGISYLYLAFEPETALAEVLSGPPCTAAIARFTTQREVQVLDLSKLPPEPSIFDEAKRDERESLLFLEQFVSEISQPVRKDGREHVGYVPSQVVCEYFALVFQISPEHHLDGIVYPSAVRPGGRNLVLFPTERGFERRFDQIEFGGAWEQAYANWTNLTEALNT